METSDAKRLRALEDANGKLRNECLNETLFGTLDKARKTLDEWQEDYNWRKPHSALANMTPMEFFQRKTVDKMAVAAIHQHPDSEPLRDLRNQAEDRLSSAAQFFDPFRCVVHTEIREAEQLPIPSQSLDWGQTGRSPEEAVAKVAQPI